MGTQGTPHPQHQVLDWDTQLDVAAAFSEDFAAVRATSVGYYSVCEMAGW